MVKFNLTFVSTAREVKLSPVYTLTKPKLESDYEIAFAKLKYSAAGSK